MQPLGRLTLQIITVQERRCFKKEPFTQTTRFSSRAKAEFAERSGRLLLQEWFNNGYVCEDYNADTGPATDVPSSDRFYHWGALLGLIVLMEHGAVEA